MKKKIKRVLISALTLSLAMGAAGIAPRVRAEENFSNLASVAAVNERKSPADCRQTAAALRQHLPPKRTKI